MSDKNTEIKNLYSLVTKSGVFLDPTKRIELLIEAGLESFLAHVQLSGDNSTFCVLLSSQLISYGLMDDGVYAVTKLARFLQSKGADVSSCPNMVNNTFSIH